MITYEVRVCIGQDDPEKRIAVKCHDTGVNLMVYLQVCRPGKWRDETEPYWIPAGSTAVIKVAKPDKTYCVCDGELTNGGVLFHMPPEAFTASGVSRAEVSLFGADTRRLTSATFDIHVPEECVHETDKESESYVDVMGKQIKAAIDAAETATTAAAHQPTISDAGTWLVWDAERVEYVDTGTTAQGSAAYKPYPVTLTQNGNKWTADHTYAEVREALSQGYSPYCIYKNFHIPCTGVDDKYKVIDYTGWLGNFTEAVFISQNASRVSVVARNTYGVDYLSFLVDKNTVGGFGYLNALLDKGTRVAVVYNLGGTPPEGQDLSAMTFPALLWGKTTDTTARTQTAYLLGAGGDRWRVTQNFDTKAVTFEQVEAGTKVYALTRDQETQTWQVICTWTELEAAVKSGATVMLDVGAEMPGASHIMLTARNWFLPDDTEDEKVVYFQTGYGELGNGYAFANCYPAEEGAVGVEIGSKENPMLDEDDVRNIAYGEVRDAASNRSLFPQADWAQENTSRADYIKNRPFYAVTTETKTSLAAVAVGLALQEGGYTISQGSSSPKISKWGENVYASFFDNPEVISTYPLIRSYADGVYTYSNTDIGLIVSGTDAGARCTLSAVPEEVTSTIGILIHFESITRTTETTVSDELAAWVKTQASIFPVTITGSGTEANPYVSDKTCNEISAAYKAGKLPVCKHPQSAAYGPSDIMCVYQQYLYPPGGPGIVEFASTSEDYSYYVTIYTNGNVIAGYRPRSMTGASETLGGSRGLVPAPDPGAQNMFLRGDATWADPPTDHTLGITSATVGQIAKITAVGPDGKPTAWEAVDIKSDDLATWVNAKIDAKLGVIENGAY